MIAQIKKDAEERFGGISEDNLHIAVAYSHDLRQAQEFVTELNEEFPGYDIYMAPLSLSVGCHIGPSSLAVTVTKKLKD